MPATIIVKQNPNRYNLVVGHNVWVLDAITSNEDAYILQVQKWNEVSATSEVIATIQQPANPAGVGMFDISKILQAQLDIAFVETTAEAVPTPGVTVAYRVRWGSITDDVPTYNGTSNIFYAFNGYYNWRLVDWSDQTLFIPFPTSSLCPCEVPPCDINANYPQRTRFLHNYPKSSIPVRSSTYHTLSFFNRLGNYDNGTQWDQNEQPYAVRIKLYDVFDNLIQTAIYAISEQTGLGPRQTFASPIIDAYTTDEWIGTIGAGPQNLKDAGYWAQTSPAIWNQVSQVWGNYSVIWNLATQTAIVDHYSVEVMSANLCYWAQNGAPANGDAATLEPYLGQTIYIETFQVSDPCTKYDPVTVSFVNQYGVKDYFTFDRRNTLTQSIGRQNYDRILGTWSGDTFWIDPHGRGRQTFSTEIQTQMSLSSYWMGDEESKWLEELYTSPHVQVFYDTLWHPAVITSTGYEQKTDARNGLFQHTLNIQFANTKKVQRG